MGRRLAFGGAVSSSLLLPPSLSCSKSGRYGARLLIPFRVGDRAIFGGMLACGIAVFAWYMGAILGRMADSIAASAWNHRVAYYWMAWHAAVGAKSSSVFGSFVDLGGFGLVLIDESRASVAAGVRDCLALTVVPISMFITK